MQKLKNFKTPSNPTTFRRSVGAVIWIVATSRNALIVVMASLAAFYAEKAGEIPFILTGSVRSGLPSFAVPQTHTTVMGANGTIVEMGFTEMVSRKFPREEP